MPNMDSSTSIDVNSLIPTSSKPFLTECPTDGDYDETPVDTTENPAPEADDTTSICSGCESQTGSDVEKDECDVDKKSPNDDGYDTDLEIEDERTDYALSGSRIYLATCKELNVVPVSYFVRHLTDEELVMRHHGLGPSGAKALAIPLLSNTSVTSLDLSDNWLEGEGAVHLAEMLKDNCYITELTISDNKLGTEGAAAICDMLCSNTTLMSINLSGNGFSDKDAERFAQAILETSTLRELNLSHNSFGDKSGSLLGHAIGENETLEMIDLSWNHFRGRSALDVIDGITVNSRLKRASLAWNGLGDQGAVAIAECLKHNHVLTELDITNNRITPVGATHLATGLDVNETLVIFKTGQNAVGAAGALLLLNAINNERSILRELDLTDVCVDLEFENTHKDMLQSREIFIDHGGVLGSFANQKHRRKKHELGPEERAALRALEDFLQNDPMAVLQTHVEKKNLRLLDLFKDLDKNNDFKIGLEDLKRKVKGAGIDLADDKIDLLINKLDKTNAGLIDYREFFSSDQV